MPRLRWAGKIKANIDWLLFFFLLPILGAGLVTMNSFIGDTNFFERQVIWIALSLIIFFTFSYVDFRFLRRTNVLVTLYLVFTGLLFILLILGATVKGAASWFDLGGFSFQPAGFMKLILVLMLIELLDLKM